MFSSSLYDFTQLTLSAIPKRIHFGYCSFNYYGVKVGFCSDNCCRQAKRAPAYIGLSARSSAKLRFGRARAHLGLPAALLGPSGPDSESSLWDPYDNMGDLVEATRLTLRL